MIQKTVPEYIIQVAKEIAGRPGHTDFPFFLFDADNALAKAKTLISASKKYFTDSNIAVAIKSCSLGIFCKLLAEEGLNAKVCSADEFQIALFAGFPNDRIILGGPLKTSEDLSFALEKDALIYVDSVSELRKLNTLAVNKNRRYGVGIRLSHFYRNGKYSRFGITKEEYINDILPILSNTDHLYLQGFHLYVGSNPENYPKITDTLHHWLPFLVEHMPSSGHLDISTDFLTNPEPENYDPETIFRSIHDVLNSYDPNLSKRWKLIFELDHYLNKDSSYVIGKALGYKNHYDAKIIQTNLSINWITSIHNWHHSLTLLNDGDKDSTQDKQILAGFNCFEDDSLSPQGYYGLTEGQHFLIRSCSNYNMQASNEWTRKKPPVYIWLRGSVLIAKISSSFTSRDLFHKEERICLDENIRLEAPSRKFSSALYKVIQFNKEYFSMFMAWPPSVNHECDTADYLDSCFLAHQHDKEKTHIILFNENPVGLVSLHTIDHVNKSGYIGYWLDKRVQGNGIITRAVNALVKHYSSRRFLHRFVIRCTTVNQRSNAVAKRCGFVHKATFREAEYLNGVFHDQNIYSWIPSDARCNS
ncbi:GNAT family N-acetyltransferase [Bartonella bacilliformis]|uniref:GNAT family N-acetyltransferase n=1 Tax=Bartonella bacilliformis TaxID=774 RepID=UPI0004A107AE|nr:GNAT family N-acetyltransferase [Bartonella bacilliformis]KEG22825.1 hypothetical protein H703_00667 [Bartonella bacilliformis Ver075]